MITTLRRRTVAVAAAAALTFGLVACSDDSNGGTEAAANGETTTVQIEDNFGTQTVTVPAENVVATGSSAPWRTGASSWRPRPSTSCRRTSTTRPTTPS